MILQFGTLTYLVTTMALYYHDGDKWVTRDWAEVGQRFRSKAQSLPSSVHQPAGSSSSSSQSASPISHGFAASAAVGQHGAR
jgi:hypothetical protein